MVFRGSEESKLHPDLPLRERILSLFPSGCYRAHKFHLDCCRARSQSRSLWTQELLLVPKTRQQHLSGQLQTIREVPSSDSTLRFAHWPGLVVLRLSRSESTGLGPALWGGTQTHSTACRMQKGCGPTGCRGSQPLMGPEPHMLSGVLADQGPSPGVPSALFLAQPQGWLSLVWGLKPLSLTAPIPTIFPHNPLPFLSAFNQTPS